MDTLASEFEVHRAHLRSVAFRMLGSRADADDAVQDAWVRLSQADSSAVENLQGFLTTIVARICLDQLRTRKARNAPIPQDVDVSESADVELAMADSLGPALLVVLDSLAPIERLAFVLHDLFAVSFDDIAGIINKTPAAARQIASRARRRVQQKEEPTSADTEQRTKLVAAFLAASRGGNFDALLEVLDPNAVARIDTTAQGIGAPESLIGAAAIATFFTTKARGARAYLVDGVPHAAWAQQGNVRIAFFMTINSSGKISGIEFVADQSRLSTMDLERTEP